MKKFWTALRWVAYAIFSIALVRDTYYNGWDFNVFHQAALTVLVGQDPYLPGLESGWVFKYPPWTLPIFVPFGLFSNGVAKLLWGLIQVGLIAYSYRWVQSHLKSWRVGFWVLASFWFLFAYHALSGQIMLLILAGCLYFFELTRIRALPSDLGNLFLLSFKIFPVLSWAGLRSQMPWDRRNVKAGIIAFVLFMFLCVIFSMICLKTADPLPLLKSWVHAAGSSATQLSAETTRGWRNQGLPALLGRLLEDRGGARSWDIPLTLILYILLGQAWRKVSASEKAPVRWAGWLGLAAAIHPLSWFHSFVLVFPIAAIAVDHAVHSKNRKRIAVAVFGVFCVTLFTKALGPVGVFAELVSVKAWGTLICMGSFKVSKA
ncbi:MAG: DUF2029 domain-containing protein [Bdellovibrionales bacterium]|nr:DUF2029 domain-containing protein [Bdellovibrionales bacterium]